MSLFKWKKANRDLSIRPLWRMIWCIPVILLICLYVALSRDFSIAVLCLVAVKLYEAVGKARES